MPNRTTVKANVVTKNVPTVTNTILTDILNAEMNDNIRFKEDVAVTQVSTVTNITIDYSGKDRVDLTRTGGSLNITLSNMEDGEEKYLLITKTAGQAVTFVGVTDVTSVAADVTALDRVLYQIVRKGIYYYAQAWVGIGEATTSRAGILETATTYESNALSVTNKIVTPGTIPKGSTSQEGIVEIATSSEIDAGTDTDGTGDQLVVQPSELKRKYDAALNYTDTKKTEIETQESWNTGTGLQSGWSGTIQYFKDNMGNVHIRTNNLARATGFTGTAGQPAWLIPSGYRPNATCAYIVSSGSTSLSIHKAAIVDVGGGSYYLYIYPEPDDYTGAAPISFYIIFQEA